MLDYFMIKILDGKLDVNGNELKFIDPVRAFIEIGEYIEVYCSPFYEDKKQWEDSWIKNGQKNTFVLNREGKKVWFFDMPSTGISKVSTFWIHPLEEIEEDQHFWIATSNFAYLISIENFSVIRTVNTYVLK